MMKQGKFQVMIKKAICSLMLIGLFACGQQNKKVDTLPYYNTPDFTPLWLSKDEAKKKELHTIRDFAFVDQMGNTVTQSDYEGKVYVADFFFTSCPSICPKLTNNLKAVSDSFKGEDKVMLISYSVTPWIDSMPRLQAYAENYEINPTQWHLVTGDKQEIYDLARKSYFAEEEPGFDRDSSEFLHTEHFVLIDQERHIRGLYNGTLALERERLIDDIKLLLKSE